jgi:predicted O-methyltransferase YrrM
MTTFADPKPVAPASSAWDAYAAIDPELGELMAQLPQTGEGFITLEQARFLYNFILLTRPRIVAETGFNVGHSACIILRAMETYGGGALISFDIGRHPGTRPGAEYVKSRFDNFALVLGDSKQTLAPTLAQILDRNPQSALDFAIVDGGHDVETARADLLIMQALLRPGGYLWLDDFESHSCRCVGVSLVGREFARSNPNCMRFTTADHRGMLIYQKGF